MEHTVQDEAFQVAVNRFDEAREKFFKQREESRRRVMELICPACQAGDHGDGAALCEKDYKCACACHGKGVQSGATK